MFRAIFVDALEAAQSARLVVNRRDQGGGRVSDTPSENQRVRTRTVVDNISRHLRRAGVPENRGRHQGRCPSVTCGDALAMSDDLEIVGGVLPLRPIYQGVEPTSRVGDRRGGVQAALGCLRRFRLRARVERAITPSPAPASSNRTGGFPASGSPRRRLHVGVMIPPGRALAFAAV